MHNQLEKYLLKIEKQIRSLSEDVRADELREIHSHLELMIAENVAHGNDPDKAVAIALEKFGSAKKVGRNLMRAKRRNHVPWWRVILACLTIIVLPFLIFWTGLVVILKWPIPFVHPSHQAQEVFVSWVIIPIILFLTGWVAECIAPKKGALSVVILCCIAFGAYGTITIIMLIKHVPIHFDFDVVQSFLDLVQLLTLFAGVLGRRRIKEGTLKPKLSIF